MSKEHKKILLFGMIAALVLINGYRFMTDEPLKTAPLVYSRGAVANSPVRQGLAVRMGDADLLNRYLERRQERYPGVMRDIFRMENIAARPKAQVIAPPVLAAPPPVAERTPAEIAVDLVRIDLAKFRFLGYLTERQDSTLFLAKDDELFMVKKGDRILKTYKIKDARKDTVVIIDTVTGVEAEVQLPGGELASPSPPASPEPQQRRARGRQHVRPSGSAGPSTSPER